MGKDIETLIHVGPDRKAFWILPGELVTKKEAANFKKYRKKAYDLRRAAVRKGLLVDISNHFLVTETMVFGSVSLATSFVLGGSRSGDVAKLGRKTLTGRNIDETRDQDTA